MDELIGCPVTEVGIDRPAVEKAVGIIIDFRAKEGPADKVRLVIAKLPGSTDAIGSGTGGVMGAGMRMMGAGLSTWGRCRA